MGRGDRRGPGRGPGRGGRPGPGRRRGGRRRAVETLEKRLALIASRVTGAGFSPAGSLFSISTAGDGGSGGKAKPRAAKATIVRMICFMVQLCATVMTQGDVNERKPRPL